MKIFSSPQGLVGDSKERFSCNKAQTKLCICENIGPDWLHGDRTADQRIFFLLHRSYNPSTSLPKSKNSSLQPSSVAVPDLVRNPENRFSHDVAHLPICVYFSHIFHHIFFAVYRSIS